MNASIQEFIDFLEDYVPHPDNPFEEEYQRPRFMIPNHPDSRDQLDYIYHDWTSLVRTDLPETLEDDEVDTRILARKRFSHPSDSLVACILALKASQIKNYWSFVSV